MRRFAWSFLPPWRWVMYEWRGDEEREVPEDRPYWSWEWWTMDADGRGTYCHLRVAGLECSWFWGPK